MFVCFICDLFTVITLDTMHEKALPCGSWRFSLKRRLRKGKCAICFFRSTRVLPWFSHKTPHVDALIKPTDVYVLRRHFKMICRFSNPPYFDWDWLRTTYSLSFKFEQFPQFVKPLKSCCGFFVHSFFVGTSQLLLQSERPQAHCHSMRSSFFSFVSLRPWNSKRCSCVRAFTCRQRTTGQKSAEVT